MTDESRSVGLIRTGSAWDDSLALGEQKLLTEHLAYIGRLAESGEVVQAGTFLALDDKPGADGLVGLVVYAVGLERARELASRDPAVTNGMIRCEPMPWYIAVSAQAVR